MITKESSTADRLKNLADYWRYRSRKLLIPNKLDCGYIAPMAKAVSAELEMCALEIYKFINGKEVESDGWKKNGSN